MTALLRYLAADLLRSQAFFLPALLFLAVLGMLNSGDPGPPLSAYQGTALVIYPVAAALTMVIANAEDPVARQVTLVTARGWGRVLAALLALAVLALLLLTALALLVPLLVNPRPQPPSLLLAGALAHLGSGLLGVAVGLLCARPLLHRPVHAVSTILLGVVLVVFLGRVPPIGNLMTLLEGGDGSHALAALTGNLALSAGLLAATAALVYAIGRKRL
ncbi:hypothetical protein M8C13_17115 [Crossiella sp. SN42]|uniref:hypothetical protein n=1 Tax=Crossiella sp. SN42 TaxID=2944808 RepID=UPI00207D3528|nr:hypothetical protein [Crossiella sp. SN42]MCO1577480.1 hypothetical protein [Crossiella sp. SN42]